MELEGKVDFRVLSLVIFTVSTLMLFGTAQFASAGAPVEEPVQKFRLIGHLQFPL